MGHAARRRTVVRLDVNTLTLRQRLALFRALADRGIRFPPMFRGWSGLRYLVTGRVVWRAS